MAYVALLGFCLMLFACTPQQMVMEEPQPPKMSPTVLFAGDSIMEGLGPVMAKQLSHRSGLSFVQAGRSSTGLCRPDFYDWPATMRNYMTTLRPQTVVICVGANDDQSVNHAGARHHFNTPGWAQAYASKVEEIIDIVAENGGTSIWVSPPIMGPDYLRPRVAAIKNIIRSTCQKKNVVFVDVWDTLADSAGKYQRYSQDAQGRKVALRTKDGVHVARAGNALLARAIVPHVEEALGR